MSSNIRYNHFEMTRPKPEECVTRIRRILRSERINRTGNFVDGPSANEQLSLIARLCKCDLRRVVNELQLFATAPTRVKDDELDEMDFNESNVAGSGCVSEFHSPMISEVSPLQVSPHDLTLLTIRGKHFSLGDGLEVFIGDQRSPALRVLNDSTVLAVCPPCSLPPGVSDSGLIFETGRESRMSRFAPVSINLYVGSKVCVGSESNVATTTEICDGTHCTSLRRQWNVEYAFPPPRHGIRVHRPVESDEESIEAEFGSDEDIHKNMALPVATRPEETPRRKFTKAEADALLEGGVQEWKSSHSRAESDTSQEIEKGKTSVREVPDVDAAKKLEATSSSAALSSDAAVLGDGFELGGVPFLSGVVPGFGSTLVSDGSGKADKSTGGGNARSLLRDANARP